MKKILALFLTVFTILTFITVPAFSAETSDSDDLKFIKAFGFVSNSEVSGDNFLTRIELAEIFYNIVFPDGVNGEAAGKVFSDVPAEKQHIASTVYGMGIMRGYSDTVFAPDDMVTYVQTVKAMVSFLGYDLQAGLLGGYPSGYLSQATRLKILPNTNVDGDAVATYNGVATMLKKALAADIAVWNRTTPEGTAVQDVLEDIDYLEYYRDVKIVRGTVTGNYLTDIQGGDKTNYFGIYLDGNHFEIEGNARGIQELLGYDVYVYYTTRGNEPTAVYYEMGTNKVIEIKARDLVSVSNGSISYYLPDEDFLQTVDFALKAPLIYNGTFEQSYTLEDLNPFAARELDGKLKLIDTNNDAVYDTVVVTAFSTLVVEDVRSNKVYARHNFGNKVVDLTHYKERNICIRNITGEPLDVSGIRKGHILSVCYDLGGNIKEIIATKDTAVGVIEEIEYAGTKISKIKVSGMTFELSGAYKISDSAGKFASGKALGCTAEIFFDALGLVTLIDLENNYTDGFKAGYVVDAGTEGGLVKKGLCMIFEEDGKMTTFELAEKVALNDTATENTDVVTKLFEGGNGRAKRQLILYKTDLDGKVITAIEIPKHISNINEAFDGIYQFPETEYYYRGGHGNFNEKYLSTGSTVTFGIPGEEDRDDYDRYVISSLPSGEGGRIGTSEAMVSMQLYGVEKEALNVRYAVVSDSNVSTGVNDKRPFFVVSQVAEAIDEDGADGLRVTGIFVEGASILTRSFFIDKSLFITGDSVTGKRPFLDQNETMPAPGDVFRVPTFTSTGRITKMNTAEFYQVYDYDDKTFITPNSGSKHHDVGDGHHDYGKVMQKVGSSVRIRRPDGTEAAFALGNRYKVAEITKHPQTGEVSVVVSTVDAVRGENTHPGEGSDLVIHYRGVGIACFVFN